MECYYPSKHYWKIVKNKLFKDTVIDNCLHFLKIYDSCMKLDY